MHPLLDALYVFVVMWLGPFMVYWYVIPVQYLYVPYGLSVLAITITNVFILKETIFSLRHHHQQKKYRPFFTADPPGDVSREETSLGVIIPAYLPNEADILGETVSHYASLPFYGKLRVLLVHNGGKRYDAIPHLKKLGETFKPNCIFEIHEVPKSSSKAHNVNYGITMLDDVKYIAIFDADARPEKWSLARAVSIMNRSERDGGLSEVLVTNPEAPLLANSNGIKKNYNFPSADKATSVVNVTGRTIDILQGRNVVVDSPIIGVEFAHIYGIFHPGGACIRGFGIFGGSNGFWRGDCLRTIRMDETMLTEDIDSGFRALLGGYNIAYSREVRSFETAPPDVRSLIKQRLRWAQGWFQVTKRHTPRIFRAKCLGVRQKFTACMLLPYREFYYYLAIQALPAAAASFGQLGRDTFNWILFTISMFPIIFTPILSFLAYHVNPDRHKVIWHYMLYAVVALPFEMLKFFISLMAHFHDIVGDKKWRVTPRSNPSSAASSPAVSLKAARKTGKQID